MMACVEMGDARIAGKGGMGDGERPVRAKAAALRDGDPAACEPDNDDLLEDVRGGFIAWGRGVDDTEVDGVIGAPV